jgi:ribonuclease-3
MSCSADAAAGRLDYFEEALGVSFGDRDLLRTALVHSSFLNENPGESSDSNERLEFLGDGLIGLVVAQELYLRYPDRAEGELTSMRSALVRGDTLARVGSTLDLGRFLVMGKGEERNGGRDRASTLAAAFEALVGALFLDQGYEPARSFVLEALAQEISRVDRAAVPTSSKSLLQELLQGQGLEPPAYRITDITRDDHARTFTAEAVSEGKVVGRGTGTRKALAEQEAAAHALRSLDLQS